MQHLRNASHDADNRELSRFASTLLILLLAVAAFSASIDPATAAEQGTIYRCVDARGSVSYQDAPCAPELRTTAIRRYTAHAVDPAQAAHRRAIEQETERSNRSYTVVVRAAPDRQKPKTPSRCETAKSKRESGLQRMGFKVSFAMMSELDSTVWDACKGL
jgi:Domain of unknown function (DUF4124)